MYSGSWKYTESLEEKHIKNIKTYFILVVQSHYKYSSQLFIVSVRHLLISQEWKAIKAKKNIYIKFCYLNTIPVWGEFIDRF